jgi:hypothetical protein
MDEPFLNKGNNQQNSRRPNKPQVSSGEVRSFESWVTVLLCNDSRSKSIILITVLMAQKISLGVDSDIHTVFGT